MLSSPQPVEGDAAHLDAVQAAHLVAEGLAHATDLAVSPLAQYDLERVRVESAHVARQRRRRERLRNPAIALRDGRDDDSGRELPREQRRPGSGEERGGRGAAPRRETTRARVARRPFTRSREVAAGSEGLVTCRRWLSDSGRSSVTSYRLPTLLAARSIEFGSPADACDRSSALRGALGAARFGVARTRGPNTPLGAAHGRRL